MSNLESLNEWPFRGWSHAHYLPILLMEIIWNYSEIICTCAPAKWPFIQIFKIRYFLFPSSSRYPTILSLSKFIWICHKRTSESWKIKFFADQPSRSQFCARMPTSSFLCFDFTQTRTFRILKRERLCTWLCSRRKMRISWENSLDTKPMWMQLCREVGKWDGGSV